MLNRYGNILAIAPILFSASVQAGEIKGVVKSAETSQPVGGAMVIVTPGGKDPVMTDDKGAYSVSGLPDGTYTVTADYAGAKKEETVTLSNDATAQVSLTVAMSQAKAETYTIEVTGSLLGATARDTPIPLFVMDKADVEKRGSPPIIEQIKTMPIGGPVHGDQNQYNATYQLSTGRGTVNVRGLGPQRTLVLFNGRRFAGDLQDTNFLPISVIGRVEVLKDGGAATYGSDAIAGVANFITRKDFSGLELDADYRQVSGSAGDVTASAAYGWVGDTSNLLLGFGYQHRSELRAAERPFATAPYLTNPTGWSILGNPGTWMAYAGNPTNPNPAADPNFRRITRDANCAELGGFVGFSGNTPACYFSYMPFVNLVDTTDQFQGYGEFNTKVGAKAKLHLEGLYSSTNTQWTTSPGYPPIQSLNGPGFLNAYRVPSTNPGFADFLAQTGGAIPSATQAFATLWRPIANGGFPGAADGVKRPTNLREMARISAELKGEVGILGMNYNIAGTHMKTWQDFRLSDLSSKRLQDAMNGLGGPGCTGTTPGTNGTLPDPVTGCQWFNPFSNAIAGNPALNLTNPGFVSANANTPALMAWMELPASSKLQEDATIFDGLLDGEVPLSLPGGTPKWALGFQYRKLNYELFPNDLANDKIFPCPNPADKTCPGKQVGQYIFLGPLAFQDLDKTTYAFFGQLDLPFFKSLNGSLGLRFENHGPLTGSTFDPQYRMKWQAFDWFAARGSIGTSFRGPANFEKQEGSLTNVVGIAATGNQFRAVDSFGNPNVGPEKAFTFNVGGIFQAKNLTATIDYWSYKIDGQIVAVNPNQIASAVAGPGTGTQFVDCSSPFVGLVTFQGGCVQDTTRASAISRVRADTVNGPTIRTSGLDGEVDYTFDNIFGGALNLGGTASFIMNFDLDDFMLNNALLSPGYSAVGFTNYNRLPGTIAKWRGQFFVNYNIGRHNFRVTTNYTDGATDDRGPTAVQTGPLGVTPGVLPCSAATAIAGTSNNCQLITYGTELGSFIPVDLTYRVALPFDFTVTASVFNLFNQDPPAARLEFGYDPTIGNPIGRTFKFGINKKF